MVTIAAVAINITVEMGLLKIALSFRDNIMPEVKDLFRSYPLILNYLAASIIYALMVLGGFALLAAGNFFPGKRGRCRADHIIIRVGFACHLPGFEIPVLWLPDSGQENGAY
ncbi:hypothetical protein [Methanothrix sp.]|uniref:hypothetical protein n=1 Tax=Methanothrix sp. TaxID=90426 RepID=UPI003C782357